VVNRWRFPIAAHLSIGSLDRPPFAATAGSSDPVAQILAAATAGFSGVCDNQLLDRSSSDQQRMGRVLADTGLELGSISLSPLGRPQLNLTDLDAHIEASLGLCLDAIERVASEGATFGSVTAMVQEGDGTREEQVLRVAHNLEQGVRFAERHDMRIGLEAVSRQRMPSSLVERVGDAALLVDAIGSPHLGLVLDSAHAWFAGDDLVEQVIRFGPSLMSIQFADMPGRVEPGAGMIDFSGLSDALESVGWTGLLEAELFASKPGLVGERAILSALDTVFAPLAAQ